jgi:import inner membrane translocase subunit TIM50
MYQIRAASDIFYYPFYFQDLACLNRDLSKVIFVDCNPKSYQLQPRNAVGLKKWNGEDDDRTLIDLAQFLRSE